MEHYKDDGKSIALVRPPRGLIRMDGEDVRPSEGAALGEKEVEGHVRSLGELEAQVVMVKELSDNPNDATASLGFSSGSGLMKQSRCEDH